MNFVQELCDTIREVILKQKPEWKQLVNKDLLTCTSETQAIWVNPSWRVPIYLTLFCRHILIYCLTNLVVDIFWFKTHFLPTDQYKLGLIWVKEERFLRAGYAARRDFLRSSPATQHILTLIFRFTQYHIFFCNSYYVWQISGDYCLALCKIRIPCDQN